jgi:hypothetical protein
VPAGLVHGLPADLRAIIDSGRGDRPLKDLQFRCTSCGSRRTDSVVMSRDALAVQPWRADDGDPASRAAGHCAGSDHGDASRKEGGGASWETRRAA